MGRNFWKILLLRGSLDLETTLPLPSCQAEQFCEPSGHAENLLYLLLSVTKREMEGGNALWYCSLFNLSFAGVFYFKLD